MCSVKGCNSGSRSKAFQKTIPTPRLFSFPKDRELQKKWIDLCGKGDQINVKGAMVCSLHFETTDYVKPLIQLVLGYSPKCQRTLKPNAIPSKHMQGFNKNPKYRSPNIKNSPFCVETLSCEDTQSFSVANKMSSLKSNELNELENIELQVASKPINKCLKSSPACKRTLFASKLEYETVREADSYSTTN
ncbi:uncharacterized protein LOC112599858 [Melanaphis sacchari]|uniref:uncharacterized protein LOC112599858 n=1 Tax=Melanaphis sacchari TaxID=742174 RepID=UPI000DC13A80|nr:uncharacterized protein LOC112599858 [Melanaphis sacchari]